MLSMEKVQKLSKRATILTLKVRFQVKNYQKRFDFVLNEQFDFRSTLFGIEILTFFRRHLIFNNDAQNYGTGYMLQF